MGCVVDRVAILEQRVKALEEEGVSFRKNNGGCRTCGKSDAVHHLAIRHCMDKGS